MTLFVLGWQVEHRNSRTEEKGERKSRPWDSDRGTCVDRNRCDTFITTLTKLFSSFHFDSWKLKANYIHHSRLLQLLLRRLHPEPTGLKHSGGPERSCRCSCSCSCRGSSRWKRSNSGDNIMWRRHCWSGESAWQHCCNIHWGLFLHKRIKTIEKSIQRAQLYVKPAVTLFR